MGKTRIVIDTNIFVSAFLGSKNAKFIVKEILNLKDFIKMLYDL